MAAVSGGHGQTWTKRASAAARQAQAERNSRTIYEARSARSMTALATLRSSFVNASLAKKVINLIFLCKDDNCIV